jgi:hypothetical protein
MVLGMSRKAKGFFPRRNITRKISNSDLILELLKEGFSKGRVLNKLRSKRHMLIRSGNMITLTNNMMPRGIFLTLPLFPFPEPIGPTIPPKMKVNIKVLSGYTVQVTDSKANMSQSNREMEVLISKKLHVKTSRQSS